MERLALPRSLFCFNPYRVFKFVATAVRPGVLGRGQYVSIPIGFSSSLQPFVSTSPASTAASVSIPIGFSSSLQRNSRWRVSKGCKIVSIPIGFSSSLQRHEFEVFLHGEKCFNPYRVFKFVATFNTIRGFPYGRQFQSLSGFQVRCNLYWLVLVLLDKRVSIPIGFSSSLQHNRLTFLLLPRGVSIPIGFSSSLQQEKTSSFFFFYKRFNPYRVFKFVATQHHFYDYTLL